MQKTSTIEGLYQQESGIWKLDKQGRYGRIQRSTRTKCLKTAERIAIKWIAEADDRAIFGGITHITFNQAAALFIKKEKKKSLKNDENDLAKLMPYLGHLLITEIANDDLEQYIQDEQKKGRKASTINRSIVTATNVLGKCARLYRDEYKQFYLKTVPLLKKLPLHDIKHTQSLTHSQEKALLSCMNDNYKDYWTFAVNTGLREQAQTGLKWEWGSYSPKLETYVFIIPASETKDTTGKAKKKDFFLVLNQTAKTIIEKQKGKHKTYVFPSTSTQSKTGKINRLNNKAFKNARMFAGLEGVINWHSARATFSTRLRANGVSEEDRATLMHHSDESITTQYSHARIAYLYSLVSLLEAEQEQEDVLIRIINPL